MISAMALTLRPNLLQKPVHRTRHEESRHATWLELFSDLAFVAAVGKIGHVLVSHYDAGGVLAFLSLFIPVWWAWVGQTMFLTRFDSDGLQQRLFHLGQIAAVVWLAASVPAAEKGDVLSFGLAYAALRLLLVAQYLWAGAHVPGAKPMTSRFASSYTFGLILFVLGAVLPDFRIILWPLALGVDMLGPIVFRRHAALFPPSREHTPERFGLFTIIVLGEVILAALAGAESDEFARTGWIIGLFGILLAFAVWWVYFDGVGGAEARLPSQQGYGSYFMWLYSHLPVHASIIIGGIGVKKAMQAGMGGAMPTAWLAVGACAVCMLFFHLIFRATYRAGRGRVFLKTEGPHWVVTALTFASVALAAAFPGGWVILMAAVLFGGHVLLVLRDTEPDLEPLRRGTPPIFRADQS